MKKLLSAISVVIALATVLSTAAMAAPALQGETYRAEAELYDGVTHTEVHTPSSSVYGVQKINIIEADLSNRNLYFDVVFGKGTANGLRTTQTTMKEYTEANNGKTALAGVNGDMWMVAYAHCRIEGKGTSYGGCSDAVAKKSVTVSRGFNMSDGEIFTTAHMVQETPFEGEFYSFGVTSDYIPVMGNPYAKVVITDTTSGKVANVDGINRLPANNALVMYTDKLMGNLNEFALDDAYEIVIEFDKDYTVAHGMEITGKVIAIYDANTSENPGLINEKQIVLTARGSKISAINSFAVGDSVKIEVDVYDKMGNDAAWQSVTTCTGGHIQFVKNGVSTGANPGAGYPTTFVGYNAEGHVVIGTIDGRQTGYSSGGSGAALTALAADLQLYNAFIVDGGGSTTCVVLDENEYKVANRPSDKFEDGSYGCPRTVVNSLIISSGPQREAQGEINIVMPEKLDIDPTLITFPSQAYVDALTSDINQCSAVYADNCLKLTANISSPVDPFCGISFSSIANKISADEYKYIVYTYKVDEGSKRNAYNFETFLMSGSTTGAVGGKSRVVTIRKNSDFQSVVLDLSRASSMWSGSVNGLRLDFFSDCDNMDTMYLYSIAFAKTLDEAKSIGDAQAALANGTQPPVETEPAETEPAETEPAETEPAETEPATTEPAVTEPAATEPVTTEPAATEPAGTDPAGTETALPDDTGADGSEAATSGGDTSDNKGETAVDGSEIDSTQAETDKTDAKGGNALYIIIAVVCGVVIAAAVVLVIRKFKKQG